MHPNVRRALFASAALSMVALARPSLALDGVVASIKPVHSLVASVMQGVGEPQLLVEGAGSAHTYVLRPSEAAMLQDASLVFWIGEGMETFLAGPLETLAGDAAVVELADAPGLVTLPFREGGPFEAHVHDDGHAHDGEAHDGHESHDHEGQEHAEDGHAEDGHAAEAHDDAHAEDHHDGHDQAAGAVDMHLWLDPENARAMVGAIEDALSQADPANAQAYAANAEALAARLDGLVAETQAALAPVRDRSFVVFHDAYQYYESRFGIAVAGSITVSPEVMPGARRIEEIRTRIREAEAACVFAEPQFEPRLVDVVIEGTGARAGSLDPHGASIAEGPDLYFELIGNLTGSLVDCLSAG